MNIPRCDTQCAHVCEQFMMRNVQDFSDFKESADAAHNVTMCACRLALRIANPGTKRAITQLSSCTMIELRRRPWVLRKHHRFTQATHPRPEMICDRTRFGERFHITAITATAFFLTHMPQCICARPVPRQQTHWTFRHVSRCFRLIALA